MRPTAIASTILAAALTLTLAPTSAEAGPREAPAKSPEPSADRAPEKRASPPPARPAARNRRSRPSSADSEEGYIYEFSDDPLAGGALDAATAVIRTRRPGVLRTLIRPRLHFIPELLKSVENV